MIVCPHCTAIMNFDDIRCPSCHKDHAYTIDGTEYTVHQIQAKIEREEWDGYVIVHSVDGTKVPLNRHRNFLRYFLQLSHIKKQKELRSVPIRAAKPYKPSLHKPRVSTIAKKEKSPENFRAVFFFILLLVIIFTTIKYQPQVFEPSTNYPPSKLEEFISTSRTDELGVVGFPKEGDLSLLSQPLKDSFENWSGEDLGEFLLEATLLENTLPPDFPLWISWAEDVYPNSSSITAAKASWSFRYSLFSEGCDLAENCVHEACSAMNLACTRTESSTDTNPYMARYSLVYRLGKKHSLEPSLFQDLPPKMKFALNGDLAVAEGDITKGLLLYQKAQKNGGDVTEELILSYALLRDFSKVQKLLSSNKAQIHTFSAHTQHVIVRSYIELKRFDDALRLLKTLPDSSKKEIQKHHVSSLKNISLDNPLSCHPLDSTDRLYCARVHIIKGDYDKALSLVAKLPLGDPTKSMTELLIAMRKGDLVAIDDALHSFVYGVPQLLLLEHPQTAYIPSLSLSEIELVLRSKITGAESRAILEWVFLQKTKRLQTVDVVSASICSALLLSFLEEKQYKRAEEKLKCLAFFEIDDAVLDFYRKYIRSHLSPDLYPKSYWLDLLGESSSRSLWYWSWREESTVDRYNLTHGSTMTYLSFASRWYRIQDGYVD